MRSEDVTEVADNVFRVRGGLVNWYLLREGRDLTLVDAGYPADRDDVNASVRVLGNRIEDIRAVLITHAHSDHLGGLAGLRLPPGTPVLVGAEDLGSTREGRPEQVGLADVVVRAWRPRTARWAVAAIRNGGLHIAPVARAEPFPLLRSGQGLDLPGRPIPISTPGHTPGHTAFFLAQLGALISGDALVTGHPITSRTGPQLLPNFFAADPPLGRSVLANLAELPGRLLLPGHGEPWVGDLARAVALATRPPARSRT